MSVLSLVAVFLPVIVLLGLAAVSALGLQPDQAHLKKSLRWMGAIAVAYGLGADSLFCIVEGGFCLLISHPKINLPRLCRRVDRALGDGNDHPGRHVP